MEKPPFLEAVVTGLCLDLILVAMAPFLGYAVLLVLAVLLLAVPFFVGAVGAPGALQWMNERRRQPTSWSGLSHLLCGSSLAFLLVVAAMEILGDPNKMTNLLEILLYLYFFVLLMRFTAAAFVNLLVSLPCMVLSKKIDRVSAVAAFVCSWAGLSLSHDFFTQQATGYDYTFMALFTLVNFAYGLAWGGAVHWGVHYLAKPEESLP